MPITIGAIGTGVGLVGKGISAYESYQRSRQAQKQLNDLQNQPIPQYQLGTAPVSYTHLTLPTIYSV